EEGVAEAPPARRHPRQVLRRRRPGDDLVLQPPLLLGQVAAPAGRGEETAEGFHGTSVVGPTEGPLSQSSHEGGPLTRCARGGRLTYAPSPGAGSGRAMPRTIRPMNQSLAPDGNQPTSPTRP